ncbi:MAG: tryptophan--tRNA ligase [Patescibacteria group bacterium]
MNDTILTGLQLTGSLHLGNYLGAVLPMVDIQKAGHTVYMYVPDIHGLTADVDYSSFYERTVEFLRLYAAAGLDLTSDDLIPFRGSHVPAHSELAWILTCFTGMGELERMTQYKDKSSRANTHISSGLLTYPTLMAADILLYGAKYVPVGEDQQQHLELTRVLARRLNNRFGECLVEPADHEANLAFFETENAVRIRSLSDPTSKMSKSVSDPKGTIGLLDDPEDARKKVMSAVTDDLGSISFDFVNQPGISNLIQIKALLEGKKIADVAAEYVGHTQYGQFKSDVADAVVDFLSNLQAEFARINPDSVTKELHTGEEKANAAANETLYRLQRAIGLRQ